MDIYTGPSPIAELLRPGLGAEKSVARKRLRLTRIQGEVMLGAVLYRLEQNQAV